jgi:hypothetical protein
MLASMLRPDSLNLPLFVHVLGAMILVGGLLATSTSVIVARGDVRTLRIGVLTLLFVCLPGYIVMRGGAQWIYSREHLDQLDEDPAWIGIGFITADAGALLLIISLILGALGMRRVRSGGGTGLLRASLIISVVLLAAYVVAIWAMGAKPA